MSDYNFSHSSREIFALLLPFDGGDYLAHELRQPGYGMRFANRDRIGFDGEEIGAPTLHERFQVKFEGVPVHKNDWANV